MKNHSGEWSWLSRTDNQCTLSWRAFPPVIIGEEKFSTPSRGGGAVLQMSKSDQSYSRQGKVCAMRNFCKVCQVALCQRARLGFPQPTNNSLGSALGRICTKKVSGEIQNLNLRNAVFPFLHRTQVRAETSNLVQPPWWCKQSWKIVSSYFIQPKLGLVRR